MPFAAKYLVRRLVSGKCELPPSMMMSPFSTPALSRVSMKSSTGLPAMTSNIMRRGFLSLATNSSMLCAPTMLLPLASLSRKRSTLETVRLKATTVKPWSAALRIRFWPMTARPMRPKSPLGWACQQWAGI